MEAGEEDEGEEETASPEEEPVLKTVPKWKATRITEMMPDASVEELIDGLLRREAEQMAAVIVAAAQRAAQEQLEEEQRLAEEACAAALAAEEEEEEDEDEGIDTINASRHFHRGATMLSKLGGGGPIIIIIRTGGYAMVVHGRPKTPKNRSFLGVTQPPGVAQPLYSRGTQLDPDM